jgi:hypothetical protein
MRHLLAAAVLTASLLAPCAGYAQTLPPPASPAKVFATVDSVKLESYKVIITGIIQGEAAPSSYWVMNGTYPDYAASMGFAQACQQQALLAMSKPGQYLLELIQVSSSVGHCKLSRVTP